MSFQLNIPPSLHVKLAKSNREEGLGEGRKSKEEYRRLKELEELRKSGAVPAMTDESGKDINPHIPQYIMQVPWYYNSLNPTLKHQRMPPKGEEEEESSSKKSKWYKRGVAGAPTTSRFRPGACDNCGAMSHKKKDCLERPRALGAKWTGRDIAPDEIIPDADLKLDFESKRDRWNGYAVSEHANIIEDYEKLQEERKAIREKKLEEKFMKDAEQEEGTAITTTTTEEQSTAITTTTTKEEGTAITTTTTTKEEGTAITTAITTTTTKEEGTAITTAITTTTTTEETGEGTSGATGQPTSAVQVTTGQAQGAAGDSGSESDTDDEDKYVDEIEMPGQKFESDERITVRNLRVREDIAKYLYNLDPNSAYYDPKTRSMRDDPFEDRTRAQKGSHLAFVPFQGDNATRVGGDAREFARQQLFAWDASETGTDVHLQADPTKAELLRREFETRKDSLKTTTRSEILKKYGGEEHLEAPPKPLLLGQAEHYVEYTRQGTVKRGVEKPTVKSCYEEDVCDNNHTSVWGSYWHENKWGYKCCHSFIRNSYCTGAAGKAAAAESIIREEDSDDESSSDEKE